MAPVRQAQPPGWDIAQGAQYCLFSPFVSNLSSSLFSCWLWHLVSRATLHTACRQPVALELTHALLVVNVMIPDYQNDTPNGFTNGFINFHISRFNSEPSFLMIVTCHYIATLSAQNGYLVRQGDFPALDYVWRVFYGYMVESITKLNEHIESHDPIRNILYKVIDLLSVEVRSATYPNRVSGRAHNVSRTTL